MICGGGEIGITAAGQGRELVSHPGFILVNGHRRAADVDHIESKGIQEDAFGGAAAALLSSLGVVEVGNDLSEVPEADFAL